MAEYIKSSKRAFTAAELSRFRRLINSWVAGIENYPRKNLGNELSVVEVWDAPIYRVLVESQYDNRTLEYCTERLKRRQNIPEPKYRRESDIDRWSLVPAVTERTQSKHTHFVRGSQAVETCSVCKGSGQNMCVKCLGKGEVLVRKQNRYTCEKCLGRGTVSFKEKVIRRYRENGVDKESYGEVTRSGPCGWCSGRGYTIQTVTVKEPCVTCGATGKVVCSTCGGEKRVVRYWSMHQNSYIQQYYQFCVQQPLSGSEAIKIKQLLVSGVPWSYVESVRVQGGNFASSGLYDRPIVGSTVKSVCKGISTPENTHLCFNEMEVAIASAKYVVYKVDGKRYACLLVGDEWRLYTVDSPVSECMNDYRAQVNTLCSRGRYGRAWGVLRKVAAFPQAGSREEKLKQQLEQRMVVTTRLGSNVTLVAMALLFVPIFYALFERCDLVAPWSRWMIEKFSIAPASLTLFSTLALFVCGLIYHRNVMPAFAYRVASPLRRFVRGVAVGVVTSLFMATTIWVAAYVGLLPLLLGALKLAFMIVAMILMAVYSLVASIFS